MQHSEENKQRELPLWYPNENKIMLSKPKTDSICGWNIDVGMMTVYWKYIEYNSARKVNAGNAEI